MTRVLLQVALPILLPFTLYFGYVYVMRRSGVTGPIKVPWPLLLGAGAVLVAVVIGALTFLDGSEPGKRYIPPRAVDGKVIPGHFE